ncbi:MAG: nuclear transport factor 2 family protein [Chitinophagales bacterium]|nr:nuclear transport factor 2 family protein [Chitinophagales bacterium]
MHTPKEIAIQWFEAFNAHNIENLLALYADDAEHYSPKLKVHQPDTNGLIRGKAALRAWWTDAFKRLPNLHYEVLKLTADEQQVFMEYIRQTPNEADLRVGEVLVINNEKITASRVYHS